MIAGPVFPLHQCQQRAVKDEQKQISISNQHIRVARWRVFNFAQVPFQCMLGIRSNSVLNSKKTCLQNVLIFKKNLFTIWNRTRNLLNASQSVALPIELYGCSFQWNVARVFSTSSSSSSFRMQADHRIDSQWQTWRRRMMVFDVRQLMCWCWQSQVSYSVTDSWIDRQMDRQTDRISVLYRYWAVLGYLSL